VRRRAAGADAAQGGALPHAAPAGPRRAGRAGADAAQGRRAQGATPRARQNSVMALHMYRHPPCALQSCAAVYCGAGSRVALGIQGYILRKCSRPYVCILAIYPLKLAADAHDDRQEVREHTFPVER
jgi:hypothetical protein